MAWLLSIFASAVGCAAGVIAGAGWSSKNRVPKVPIMAMAASVLASMFVSPVWGVLVGSCVASYTGVRWLWSRRPPVAHRTLLAIDPARWERIGIIARDLVPQLWTVAALSGLAAVLAALSSVQRWWPGVVAVAIVTLPVARPPRAVTAGGDVPAVVAGAALQFDEVSEALRIRDGRIGAASSETYLFRGLLGWNLGLGLDAEEAAWAGQLARRAGLGDVLAEPVPIVSPVDARVAAICRALARRCPSVVIENPLADLVGASRREVVRLIAGSVSDRALYLVVSDPTDAERIRAAIPATV